MSQCYGGQQKTLKKWIAAMQRFYDQWQISFQNFPTSSKIDTAIEFDKNMFLVHQRLPKDGKVSVGYDLM